jgi:hypothetical protein
VSYGRNPTFGAIPIWDRVTLPLPPKPNMDGGMEKEMGVEQRRILNLQTNQTKEEGVSA